MIRARNTSQAIRLNEDDLYLIEESESEVTLSLKKYSSGSDDDTVFEDEKFKPLDDSNSTFNEKYTKAEHSVDVHYGGGEQIAINFKNEEENRPNTSTFSEKNIEGEHSVESQFINGETIDISSEDDEKDQSNIRSNSECVEAPETWYTCQKCFAKLTTEKYKNDHELRCFRKDEYFRGRTFDCSYCQLAHITEDGKNQHEAVCRKRPDWKMYADDTCQPRWKRYSCDECSYETMQKHHLIRHMRTHDKMRTRDKLRTHDKKNVQSALPYFCEYCAFQTTQNRYLMRHVRRLHSSFGIICSLCQKPFSEKGSLDAHYVSRHPDRADKWKDIITHKIYECPNCDYKTIRTSDFKEHLTTHDTHADKYKFYCNICEYKTVRKRDYTRHVLRHSGQQPYVCVGCNKKFVRKRELDLHIINQHSLNKALLDSDESSTLLLYV